MIVLLKVYFLNFALTAAFGSAIKLKHKNPSPNFNLSRCSEYFPQIFKLYGLDNIEAGCYEVSVDECSDLGDFPHFWKSTGFCPPGPHKDAHKFLLSHDMHQNLALIGSLPYQGISQVRVHWLLDLVQMRLDCNVVIYNFTYLDSFLDILKSYDLVPGFELMGNPNQMFSDFENATQVFLWKDLIAVLAKHYIEKYGIDYVSRWNFETWNEPDHHDFDGLNFTVQGFKNYYDACSEGLKLASSHLHFGGPGGSCHIPGTGSSPICWELLQHCQSGKNYFTNETGNRIDFISFHKKGNKSSSFILEQEIETISYIWEYYHALKHVPIYNDEADPLKTWSLPQVWRSDVTYAAVIAKVIAQHIKYFYLARNKGKLKDVNYQLLSNDNGFLSYYPYQFLQRTLFARFQVNNTNPNYVQLVQKPVYSVMGLLSKLCTKLLKTVIIKGNDDLGGYHSDNFGSIATKCHSKSGLEIAILMYYSADTKAEYGAIDVKLKINSELQNGSDIKWVLYEINNEKTNPFAVWKKLGQPDYPSVNQFSIIKDHEAPHVIGPASVNATSPWKFRMKIFKPGISLVHICKKITPPEMVQNVQLLKINPNILQITWKDKNRCILTYNVEHSEFFDGPFIKINKKRNVFPSYWHSCDDESCIITGFYRVQAVDYWNQCGPYSVPISL